MKTEVMIIGAGPTGLSLACQLVRFGVDFIIIDKKEGPTPLSKALGVHARTLEVYEQLGIVDKAIEQGVIADKVKLIGSTNGHVYDGFSLAEMGSGMSPFPYMLVLEQSKNEEILYEYLQTHQKDVQWTVSLDEFWQDDSGVTAVVTTEEGKSETITAQYLVGCDGASSPVRKSLGFSFEGDTEERLFYVADAYLDADLDHSALHSCFAQDAFLFFFPIANEPQDAVESGSSINRWRILGNLPETVSADDEIDMSNAAIEQRIQTITKRPLQIRATNWSSTYRVHTRRVDKFSEGRCYLAGDAAHVHTPAGGQGMNTGIQDAYNLAWKLAFVLKGQASESLLETYNTERLENAKNLVESTDRMFELEAGSNWFVGLVRSFLLPPLAKHLFSLALVQRTLFSLISQIGISYPDSALSVEESSAESEAAVKVGDRIPYFTLEGESIYHKLLEPKFHLLTFCDNTPENSAKNLLSAIEQKQSPWLLHTHLPLSDAVTAAFGISKPFSVLVRPDNHISFISRETSTHELSRQLDRYFSQIGAKDLIAAE